MNTYQRRGPRRRQVSHLEDNDLGFFAAVDATEADDTEIPVATGQRSFGHLLHLRGKGLLRHGLVGALAGRTGGASGVGDVQS